MLPKMKYLKGIRILILFEEHYLTNQITDEIKGEVIRLYLRGLSRNDIARICGVGEGTVSNIIDEWKHSLDIPDVQALRDLAVNLKRCGIDAAQCTQGLRILNTIKKLGVNQNQVESFMIEVYDYCQNIGLAPQDIASNLQALINLSKDIPFSKIPEHIKEKKKEKTQIEENIKTLEDRKGTLEIETSTAKELHDVYLQEEKTTIAKLKQYSNFKTKLRKFGMPIDDVPKLVQVLYGIRQHGYDVERILSEYQDLQFFKDNRARVWREIREWEDKKARHRDECSFLEAEVSRHSQRLHTYDELESLGLGIKELRILCNTIKEIAAENGKSYRVAIEQFIEQVEKLYDGIKLRQKINQQKEEQQKYAKPDDLPRRHPYHPDVQPFAPRLERSILEDQERERPMPSVKYHRYWETKTTNYKTTREEEEEEEENGKSDNDNSHDGDIWTG
ncbi:MAG: helix-turn-helix domain-containing protein [Thermoproteota archaeon]|nr:helix-turn-helix domain-containing protein [Thermoproteota archaeon]